MLLYPAIDILEGRAVRLLLGSFEDQTIYHDDPLDAARSWVEGGAERLHVVDLDGARSGTPASLGHLERIVGETGIPVQYGGGLRTRESVDAAVRAGADRVVIGTAAFRDLAFLDAVLGEHGDKVAIAIDIRGDMVSTAGWTETTQLPAVEAVNGLRARGAQHFIYTSVDRDGAQQGPDLDGVQAVAQSVDGGTLIYSGGIGTLEHLAQLHGVRPPLHGVIVGKALYEGNFTVAEAAEALAG